MSLKQNQIRIIIIVICIVILASGPGSYLLFPLSSIGYTGGYEGVKASFSGLEWQYSSSEGAQDLGGTSFFFDADEPLWHACNLVGEMTNAFVPERSRPASWVLPEWWDTATQYIKNPVNTYTWDLPNPDNPDEIIAYEMQEWNLKMYLTITAEWDKPPSGPYMASDSEYGNQRYIGTKVWVELDVSPTWIFQGQPETYFAIGKVVCSDFEYGKLGTTEEDYTSTNSISVTPESKTSYGYIYYQNYGKAGQVKEFDPNSYKGRVLNPGLFTDKVYLKVSLNNFGTQYELAGPVWDRTTIKKGDAVTWGFDVHVFVV